MKQINQSSVDDVKRYKCKDDRKKTLAYSILYI